MGNSCCGNRIPKENTNNPQFTNVPLPEIIQQDLKNANSFQLSNKDEPKNIETNKDTKICEDEVKHQTKHTLAPNRLTPTNFPYTLCHFNSLTNNAKSTVSKNFNPLHSSSENIIGHISIINSSSQNKVAQKLILTNYALYTIENKNDLNISSKVLISSINFLFISESQQELLIHTMPSEHSTTLWFYTEKLKDFFNYLQSTHYSLTQFCIPYKTVPLDTLKDYYKNFPTSVSSKISDEIFKKTLVSIFGLLDLTENLEFVIKCKGVSIEFSNVFLALTNKAIYTLSPDFNVENRTEYENINSLLVSPGMEKVVILERDGDKTFYFVGNNFLAEFRKLFANRVKRQLRMNICTEIEEYSKINAEY